jgi:hypothetical protein
VRQRSHRHPHVLPPEPAASWWVHAGEIGNVDILGKGWVSFFSGWGDTVSLGATKWGRRWGGQLAHVGDANSVVDYDSSAYLGGELVGTVQMTLMDGAGLAKTGSSGALRVGMRRPLPGMAFGRLRNVEVVEKSHWIPNRFLPTALKGTSNKYMQWNLKLMWSTEHAVADANRFQLMPRAWKESNLMYSPVRQQWVRIPDPIKGGGLGLIHGLGYISYSEYIHHVRTEKKLRTDK